MKSLEDAIAESKKELLTRFTSVTNKVLTPGNRADLIDAYVSQCYALLEKFGGESEPVIAVQTMSTDAIRDAALKQLEEGEVSTYGLLVNGTINEGDMRGAGRSLGVLSRQYGWVAAGEVSYRKSDGTKSNCKVYKQRKS